MMRQRAKREVILTIYTNGINTDKISSSFFLSPLKLFRYKMSIYQKCHPGVLVLNRLNTKLLI